MQQPAANMLVGEPSWRGESEAMVPAQYPYLDLTVLPELRGHVIAPNAVVLFSEDLGHVLWANGEGSSLIGASNVRSALENGVAANPAMMRQIAMAVEKLGDAEDSTAIMRVRRGFKTRLVGFTVRNIKLPQGETAVLLLTESLYGRGRTEAEMAMSAVEGLDGYSHASAIVDSDGAIVAASQHFASLGVPGVVLAKLAHEAASEADRLVKRPIETATGVMPAGVARLSDEPMRQLLVIADAEEAGYAGEEAVDNQTVDESETDVVADTPVADAPTPTEEEPKVGAFSSKRVEEGVAPINRWYYKARTVGRGQSTPAEVEDSTPSKPLAQEDKGPELRSANETASPVDLIADEIPSDRDIAEALAASQTDRQTISEIPTQPPEIAVTATPEIPPLFEDVRAPIAEEFDQDAYAEEEAEEADFEEPVARNEASEILTERAKLFAARASAENDSYRDTDSENSGDHAPEFRFEAGSKPIRFVWEMDSETVFQSVSQEFADTVGPKSAAIEGLAWSKVGELRGLENANEIAALLHKGDTWSGKTVLWPVEGTDLRVPVDLAGLPSYGRSRSFDGFNGFGIVRTADAMVDSDASGLDLARSNDANAPAKAEDDADDKVVALDSRRAGTERALSSEEQTAFHEIAETLSVTDQPVTEEPNPVSPVTPESFQAGDNAGFPSAPESLAASASTGKVPSVDTSILARLPIPVLVYREVELLFANEDFFKLTGHVDLPGLAGAGGLEALFGGPAAEAEDTAVRVFAADGKRLKVDAHLQRVPWDDDQAMLLTLRNGGGSPGPGPGGDPQGRSTPDENRNVNRPPKGNDGPPSPPSGNDPAPGIAPLLSDTDNGPRLATVTPLKRRDDSDNAFGGLNNEALRGILDTATDGVIIMTQDGTVRALNRSAEALFDVNGADAKGKAFTDMLALESHRAAVDYLDGVSGAGVASVLNDGRDVIGLNRNGGLIPLFMTIGKAGDSDNYCAVVRDVTQWKRAEEELLAAKQQAEFASDQKTDFLAKISHEIRTPMNAIIGFSDLMVEERFGRIENDRYRGYLRDINRSGNHVLELINDLLDISKIEAGKMDLDFDACDLNATVLETVALVQPQANKERVIIRTSLSAAVPKIVADVRSLRQIILNLLSNGIKYTRSGGQVIISSVYQDDGEVVLRIRDTGVGMSEAELQRAMKPFEQIGASASASRQGTGLGLPLTKAMVDANRADFHIESEPDRGTLVEVHFPSQRVLPEQ